MDIQLVKTLRSDSDQAEHVALNLTLQALRRAVLVLDASRATLARHSFEA